MSTASVSCHSPSHSSSHRLTPRAPTQRSPAAISGNVHTPFALNRQSPILDVAENSPNYFNLSIEHGKSCESSAGGLHARGNFSPPSSRIRSTAAISPRVIPLDQNPDFDAFRKQTEANPTRSAFNISLPGVFGTQISSRPENATPAPPFLTRAPSGGVARLPATSPSSRTSGKPREDNPRSPKRQLSSPRLNITDRPRRNSPAGFTERQALHAPQPLQFFLQNASHMSLPTSSSGTPPPSSHVRSETLPAMAAREPPFDLKDAPPFVSPSHVATLTDMSTEGMLLLDLRVSTQYAKAKISGALNLCIPTTLLKRASYNTQRLAETFKDEDQRGRFERWRASEYIVVYDGNSSRPKDAVMCVNMLKKFASEGWTGQSYIIRGGFQEFSKQFPSLVETSLMVSSPVESRSATAHSGGLSSIAPVIGGCPMPSTKSAANPFFGNIRQNMDLIGGVGQMSITVPNSMGHQQFDQMPQWLREASASKDKGQMVAEKFLNIEKREQKRMQQALTANVTYGSPGPGAVRPIQIAGIEKGAKNRYNNIWPYEHSRVKLEGPREGGCDYINANHIKAAWSNKTYIATQGPIPATFTDFWNAVWQQDVRVIVMLTAESEGGQIKAHNYWSEKRYGHLHLHFLSEHKASLEPSKIHRHRERPSSSRRRSTNPHFGREPPAVEPEVVSSEQPFVTVRRFTLSSDLEPFARMREITQLQYSSWPDFGAPAHPTHLLGLVEQTDAVVRASGSGSVSDEARPVIVHCSAGCGRTGTFCTVDSVVDMMKKQRATRNGQPSLPRQPTPMELDTSFSMREEPSSFLQAKSTTPQPPKVDDKNWIFRDNIDLIEKTVEDFRLQRLSMVQSLRQYVLCYESVMEWLVEQTPKSA